MAKKKPKEINKAAEIRAEFAKNPNAGGTEIVAALAKRGITVAAAQVSNVKTATAKKNGSHKGRNGSLSAVELVKLARSFVEKTGGTKAAVELIEALG